MFPLTARDRTLEQHIAAGDAPAELRSLAEPMKTLSFVRLNTGDRMTREQAANAVEDVLNEDAHTLQFAGR
jgi:hypothetical protein